MALSIGIVGLPNAGKSTLFNALTDANVLAAAYPFATIEPNTGIVPIPDPRLAKLAQIYNTDKIVPATVTFVDIAGLVAGASKGEGLGNQFLSHIRACNAICHVVRAFANPDVPGQITPAEAIDVINTELILADLQTVDARLPRLAKEAKADSKLKPVLENLELAKKHLEDGTPLSRVTDVNLSEMNDLFLLSAKPVIYVFNVDEDSLRNKQKIAELSALVAPSSAIFICAKLEAELKSLDSNDAVELLKSYGFTKVGLEQLVHEAHQILGLHSFLTAGEKEVRAWTIPVGATAPQAAGVIHTDFERGFIAAQVVDYTDLIEAGSLAIARANGKVRTEGRDYIMQPGDVVEFKFNV